MGRRRALFATHAQQLKQTTLFGFGESSAPSPPAQEGSTSKPSRRHAPTRPLDDARDKSPEQDDSDVGAIGFEPEAVDLTDEDQLHVSPPKRRGTRVIRSRAESPANAQVLMTPTEDLEEEVVPPLRKGKRKTRLICHSSSEELRPQKRKLVKGIRPPSPDENDILDDVDKDKILGSRLRIRGRKTAYQKSLEKLRKNRGRVSGASEPESSASLSSEDDGEEDSCIMPFRGAKPDNDVDSDASYQKESEDDNFIVEDDGTVAPELPVDFSMSTHQDLAHHFKIICQFFVHLVVRPPAERGSLMEESMKANQYVSVPLQIARRKLTGLMESVASSVWRPEFKNVLKKYPDLELVSLDFAIPSCDACHLGGRMSTLLGRLSGTPYKKWGFEPLHSSGDDDDDEQPVKEFHLGRFCARRTVVFHNFCHWEYALFKFLSQEMDELRATERGFVRVAYANGIQPPEDLSDADGVMDWLDQRKIIDLAWQRLKDMVDSANKLDHAKRDGENDD